MPGDHQEGIEEAVRGEQSANSVLKKLLSIYQAVDMAIRGETKLRCNIISRVDAYRLALKKGAALLFATKDDLNAKDGELAR